MARQLREGNSQEHLNVVMLLLNIVDRKDTFHVEFAKNLSL